MNILIVNGYVRQNKGDAALMNVLCDELKQAFPHARMAISSQEDPAELPRFEQWRNIGSLNRYCFDPTTSKLNHFARLFLCSQVALCLLILPRRCAPLVIRILPKPLQRLFNALFHADLVVSMGGGYLNGNASMMANACVFLMLIPLRLAKRLGATVVCAPQSMGPFATTFQKIIARHTLQRIDLLLTREQKTTALLKTLSAELPIQASVDSGFLFTTTHKADIRRQLNIRTTALLIGVTVRRWLDPQRQQAYEQAVAQTIDYAVRTYKATVLLIPQVTSQLGGDDDRITARHVYDKIAHKQQVHVLTEDYSHHDIKALYNALDLLIGTRFHSVIFSLTSFVPALAIEYEHKTSGIMHELGLDDWVVAIEHATADTLTTKLRALVASRQQYQKHLHTILPDYIATAKQATVYIEQAYALARH